MKLSEKWGSLPLYTLATALAVGFGWVAWAHASQLLAPLSPTLPLSGQRIAATIGIILLLWYLELVAPLLALPRLRWVYHDRPTGQMRGIDGVSIAQLIGLLSFGILLFLALKLPPVAAVALPILRVVCSRRRSSLSTLLDAGRTRTIFGAGMSLMDSEVVSDALASRCMKFTSGGTGGSSLSLLARRLRRRYYIWVGAGALVGIVAALSGQLHGVGVLVFVPLWGVVSAAVGRVARFDRVLPETVGGSGRDTSKGSASRAARAWDAWGQAVVATCVMSLVGAGIVALLWHISMVGLVIVWLCAWHIAYERSTIAQETSMTLMDMGGIGATMSPEVVRFFTRGLKLSLLVLFIALKLGVG